jgi:AcrR family transcriptional regulator
MPKVTQRHLDARKMQILRAARQCFSRQGFHRTTMRDIVCASRLSPGAIYRYFKGKDEIIKVMAAMRLAGRRERLSAVGKNSVPGALVADLLQTFFQPLEADANERANRRVIIQVWAEALRSPRILKAMRRNLHSLRDLVADAISRGQQLGEIRPDLDAKAVALTMIALLQGFMLHEAWNEQPDPNQYFKVIQAAFGGLRNGAEIGAQMLERQRTRNNRSSGRSLS